MTEIKIHSPDMSCSALYSRGFPNLNIHLQLIWGSYSNADSAVNLS